MDQWNYEGRSKSSRPDLVLFRIKLKYYLILIVGRLRTLHAQYDIWAISILWILLYEHSVCQMGVENANTKQYTSFWRTSQTIPTWPSKNLFLNSLFRMKRASTKFNSESEQQSMQWNERIGQICHFITPLFHVECK